MDFEERARRAAQDTRLAVEHGFNGVFRRGIGDRALMSMISCMGRQTAMGLWRSWERASMAWKRS
jgi:hypothetical protein